MKEIVLQVESHSKWHICLQSPAWNTYELLPAAMRNKAIKVQIAAVLSFFSFNPFPYPNDSVFPF